MKNKETALIILSLLSLTACSSVSNIFSPVDKTSKLEGERISVLELQKDLSVDTQLRGESIILPQAWNNQSWPQAGGFPTHAMQNLSFSKEPPQKLWSTEIGQGSSTGLPLNAPPIVAEGKIFTLDARARLSAFNAETGKELWSIDISSKKEKEHVITGGISHAHNTLFVTNGHGEAMALSPLDGSLIWRKNLPASSRAAPSILSGKVYISTIDSRLIALNAKDGAGLWEYHGTGETAGLFGAASPAVNHDVVIAAFSSGEITALRVENGAVIWSENLSAVNTTGSGLTSLSDIKAMPVITQGLVIAMSYGGKIAAIDERTGARIWQREISGTRTPWVAGKMMFVLSSENQLIGMNTQSGAIFWIEQLAQFEDEKRKKHPVKWSDPILAEGRIILAGSHGQMIEVNPNNGKIIHAAQTKQNIRLSPALANQTLYLLSEDGRLTAYR
ncbi:MAG: PQQ-binding-like beta-propeller repeat protein [Alphaproteobacteria bacterium]